MAGFRIETFIDATPGACFDLVRDSRVQPAIVALKGETAVGQLVTFEISSTRTMVVEITEFRYAEKLVDTMISGPLASFVHTHEFCPAGAGTVMRDTVGWTSPFGLVGRVLDTLYLERRLKKLVTSRNNKLKQIAENNGS